MGSDDVEVKFIFIFFGDQFREDSMCVGGIGIGIGIEEVTACYFVEHCLVGDQNSFLEMPVTGVGVSLRPPTGCQARKSSRSSLRIFACESGQHFRPPPA